MLSSFVVLLFYVFFCIESQLDYSTYLCFLESHLDYLAFPYFFRVAP